MRNLFILYFLLVAGLASVYGEAGIGRLQAFKSTKISNAYVTSLAEDEDGFLWIGTQKGLNRYNGSTYRIYYHQDSLSLSSDNILSLYADTQRRLWVGTDMGINLIQAGEVVRPSESEFGNLIFAMESYDEDHLLFSYFGGLGLYRKSTAQVTDSVVADMDVACSTHIRCVDRYICVALPNKQIIYVYDRNFRLQQKIPLPQGCIVNDFTVDAHHLYVSTSKGLFCYAIGNGLTLQTLPLVLLNLTRGKNVLAFHLADFSSLVYVAIAGEGLFSYDFISRQQLRLSAADAFENVHRSICLVTSHYLWFSRNRNPPQMFPLQYLDGTIVFDLKQGDRIIQVMSYGEQTVLMRAGYSLYAYDAATRQIHDITPKDISAGKRINKEIVDGKRHIWLLMDYDTVKKYAWQDGHLHLLKEIQVEQTTDILPNGDKGIYLLQRDELVALNLEGQTVGRYPLPPFLMPKVCTHTNRGNTYFIFIDRYSVYQLMENAQVSKVSFNAPWPYCFYEGPDDILWVGTFMSGLYGYDKDQRQVYHFSTENGLPDNSIRSVYGDKDGNIWVSMRDQLSRISLDRQSITTYENNMMDASYSTNCVTNDEAGNLYFGGDNFMICISPESESYVARNIPLYWDGILVNNTWLDIDGKELTLDYDENQLTVYYSALYFSPSISVNYSYLLEGYHEDWVYAGRSEYALFSNLPSGSYRLRVRVQNPTGEWNAHELLLPIRIKPHPLLSPGAKGLYVLTGVLLLVFIGRMIVRRKREQERRLVDDTKKAMNEQLKQEKIDFFINISHEFRTPLSLIYAPAKELAERSSVSPADRRLLATIENNAERMLRLSEQLLNFDRLDFENKRLMVGKNDLALLVQATAENLRFLAEQKGITLSEKVPSALTAYYDREKVEKVLYNLLSNAIKYTPCNGHITVEVEQLEAAKAQELYRQLVVPDGYAGRYAEISVRDTGPGIPPQIMERLFNRYERGVDAEGAPVGFGIGLDYAMQQAVLHRGMLRVISQVGQGSCFYFAFPMEKAAYGKDEIWIDRPNVLPAASVSPSEATGEAFESDKVTVLLVEDDVDMRTYLKGLFSEAYNVLTASNGVEAMDGLSVAMPDLIISDVMMPYKDGLTLCNEIKNNPEICHLPVILLTAKAETDDLIQGLDCGADAYVRKPFDPKYLLVVVRNVLANRQRLQAVISRISAPLEPDAGQKLGINPQDEEFLNKLYELTDRFLDNEDFNIASIAGELNISRSSFYSKVKTLTGQSPQLFLGTYRLNKSMELLKTRQYTVSEVCYKVGFNSVSSFSRSFKKKFGVSPSDVGK